MEYHHALLGHIGIGVAISHLIFINSIWVKIQIKTRFSIILFFIRVTTSIRQEIFQIFTKEVSKQFNIACIYIKENVQKPLQTKKFLPTSK